MSHSSQKFLSELLEISSFLSNNYNKKENICDNNQFTNRESSSGSRNHNKKLLSNTLDQHFKCKKLCFNNAAKEKKENEQKVDFIKKDTLCSFDGHTKDLNHRRYRSHSNEDAIESNLSDGKENVQSKPEAGKASPKQSLEIITNENKGCSSANSSNEQPTNYQKLLEDDLDFFQALITCSNDEFVDLLCSVGYAKKPLEPRKKNESEERLLQLKYVQEADRSKPTSKANSQDISNGQQSQPRTLCERCSAEILSSSKNNSQKAYQFKYLREIKRSNDGNCGNNETLPKYQRLNSQQALKREGFMHNSIDLRNEPLLAVTFNRPSAESERRNIQQRDLEQQNSVRKCEENESDFTSLHSLSSVKSKTSFPFSICTGLNKKYQEELQKIQEQSTCQIFPSPNRHREINSLKRISCSNEVATENTQRPVGFPWDVALTPTASTQNLGESNKCLEVHSQSISDSQTFLVPNDHTKTNEKEYTSFREKVTLENTQPSSSSWCASQTSRTQNLEDSNNYVGVQDVGNSTTFHTFPTFSRDDQNKCISLPTQNLTKIDEFCSNGISQSTSTKRLQILHNILLDDTSDILNTFRTNKGCVISQNKGLKYHDSNVPIPETKSDIYTKVVPAKKRKPHILKRDFAQNVSFEEQENSDPKDYSMHLVYLKEFLLEKLQDIREYLHKYENEQNGDNNTYINNILNNLNNSNEETFLGILESQDIFSQPLSYTPTLVNRASLKCSQTSERNAKKNPSSFDQKLANVIDNFINNKALISQGIYDIQIPENIKKMFILQKMSDIFIKLLNDIENHRMPMLRAATTKAWENYEFDGLKLMLIPSVNSKTTKISLQNHNSRSIFNLTIFIMGKIVDLLINDNFCTKRELYYQVKNFVRRPVQVNTAVNFISCIIEEPPWDFGIHATQKGLVYGDLTITLSGNEIINCNTFKGTLIPHNLNKITKLESNASFILIVEKDSIFQKLLDEGLPNRLPRTFILITGKGSSDASTRLFIKKLWQILYIPVFALVDANPYGIEIMLTYRFGSMALAHLSDYLALPSLRWIGIHPKEIVSLNITKQALTPRDKRKIHLLLGRPYMNSVPKIREELELMLQQDFKAEIEGVMKGNNYLKNFYIPSKLCAEDFI